LRWFFFFVNKNWASEHILWLLSCVNFNIRQFVSTRHQISGFEDLQRRFRRQFYTNIGSKLQGSVTRVMATTYNICWSS
jgi:hypothetical protein